MGMDYGGKAKIKHDTWAKRFDKWASSQSGACITRKLSEDEINKELAKYEGEGDKVEENKKNQPKSVKEDDGTKVEVCFSYMAYEKGYLVIPKNVLVCDMNDYIKQNLGRVKIRDSQISDEHISYINLVVNEETDSDR